MYEIIPGRNGEIEAYRGRLLFDPSKMFVSKLQRYILSDSVHDLEGLNTRNNQQTVGSIEAKP